MTRPPAGGRRGGRLGRAGGRRGGGCRRGGPGRRSARGAGTRTNARSCMRGCGTVRRSSAIVRSSISRMSMSMVRGPQRTSRTRPSSDSTRLTAASSSSGSRSVSISTTTFRKSGCSGPPTGSVSQTRDVRRTRDAGIGGQHVDGAAGAWRAGRPGSSRDPGRPPWRATRQRRGGGRGHAVDPQAAGGVRLVDHGRHPRHPIEREDLVGDRGRHRLDQVERALFDDRADGLGDAPVVGRALDVVVADVHLDVQIHDELLRLVLLAGTRAVAAARADAGQEQPRRGHSSSSSSTSCQASSSTSAMSTHGGRRSSWIVTMPDPSPCPPWGSCRYRARRYS